MINHSCYIIGIYECRILCLMMKTTLSGCPLFFHANCKRILDWDAVGAVPLKLSTISIRESFFPVWVNRGGLNLDSKLDDLFRQELSHIEWEKSSSTKWSQMFLHSEENRFLHDILRWGSGLSRLQRDYPDLLPEILYRSPEKLALAESAWNYLAQRLYTSAGVEPPDYPQLIEIQEGLGLYGRSQFARILHRLKRNVLKRWNVMVDKLRSKFRRIWKKTCEK
jgi:hypothetical protein